MSFYIHVGSGDQSLHIIYLRFSLLIGYIGASAEGFRPWRGGVMDADVASQRRRPWAVVTSWPVLPTYVAEV